MDETDRAIVNAIQSAFPITVRPYRDLAQQLEPVSYTHLTLPTN